MNRKLILDEVGARDDHPAAADNCEDVRRRNPKISLGSVYKALQFLTDGGYVSQFHLDDELARYDRNTTRHDHAACRQCGRLADVKVEISETAVQQAAGRAGFRVDRRHVELTGVCNLCQ